MPFDLHHVLPADKTSKGLNLGQSSLIAIVVGIITKEHVADSVADSIQPYANGHM
jgi:hypothetical protein